MRNENAWDRTCPRAVGHRSQVRYAPPINGGERFNRGPKSSCQFDSTNASCTTRKSRVIARPVKAARWPGFACRSVAAIPAVPHCLDVEGVIEGLGVTLTDPPRGNGGVDQLGQVLVEQLRRIPRKRPSIAPGSRGHHRTGAGDAVHPCTGRSVPSLEDDDRWYPLGGRVNRPSPPTAAAWLRARAGWSGGQVVAETGGMAPWTHLAEDAW